MKDAAIAALLLGGVSFMFIACLGVVRMPDVFCRAHALSKAMTMGVTLMLLALWIHLGGEQVTLRVILAIAFQLATLPVAAQLVGLIALKKNVPRWKPPKEEPERKPRR